MHCPINKVIVTLTKKFHDELTLKSGLVLYQDTKFRPEQHVTTMGKVIGVPESLSDMIENEGVEIKIKTGDEVCFSYQVVYDVDDNGNHEHLFVHEGEEYWFVEYGQIFFVKRGEEVIPIAGNVVVNIIESEIQDTFKGSLIIMPETSKEPVVKGQGIVKYIGEPLTTDPTLDVQIGDTVFFKPELAAEYEIWGKKQVIIHQRDLLAKAI